MYRCLSCGERKRCVESYRRNELTTNASCVQQSATTSSSVYHKQQDWRLICTWQALRTKITHIKGDNVPGPRCATRLSLGACSWLLWSVQKVEGRILLDVLDLRRPVPPALRPILALPTVVCTSYRATIKITLIW
jgi:hypothetical protein